MTQNAIIAASIRRERGLARLTLSALADKAGLAKSTLSQLEAGKGNPNVETLWAIATALGLPFSALFENTASQNALIRASEGVDVRSDQAEFAAVLLDKCPPDRRRDLYRVSLRLGSPRQAAAHPQGTIEHAFICRGRVRLGPKDQETDAGPGDYFRYSGGVAHVYEALTEDALLLLVMDSPR